MFHLRIVLCIQFTFLINCNFDCQQPSKLCAQDESGIVCKHYETLNKERVKDIREEGGNDNVFNSWELKLKNPNGFVPFVDDKKEKSSISWF